MPEKTATAADYGKSLVEDNDPDTDTEEEKPEGHENDRSDDDEDRKRGPDRSSNESHKVEDTKNAEREVFQARDNRRSATTRMPEEEFKLLNLLVANNPNKQKQDILLEILVEGLESRGYTRETLKLFEDLQAPPRREVSSKANNPPSE